MVPDKVAKLLQRAQQAIAQRDWEKAKQVYLMALGLKSDLPDIHYGLATVFFQLRELTGAAHHFREVTRLDPLRSGAFVNLGAILNLLGQYDEAIAALRRAIQLDPRKVDAYYNLGLVYRRKGQPDLAMGSYKEALRLNPRMADAHLNLANLYLDKQQWRPAVQHYELALHIRPGWDKAADGLEAARAGLSAEAAAKKAAASPAGAPPTQRLTPGGEADQPLDPVAHAAFLTTLHKATLTCGETGKLLQKLLAEEVEPILKELSGVMLHVDGTRGELDACLDQFDQALQRLKTTRQAIKGQLGRIEDLGGQFPTA